MKLRNVGSVIWLAALIVCKFSAQVQAQTTWDLPIIGTTFPSQFITISAGDTVVWQNGSELTHTVTSDLGDWDSGALPPGQSFTFTFTTNGVYPYHCMFHGSPGFGMYGIVTVVSPGRIVYVNINPSVSSPPAVFSPQNITVDYNQIVVWINNDTNEHLASADDGFWATSILFPANWYSLPIKFGGNFPYQCTIHTGMTGTLTVNAFGTPVWNGWGSGIALAVLSLVLVMYTRKKTLAARSQV